LTSKTTTEGSTTVERVEYVYNLQNRLAGVTTTPYLDGQAQSPTLTEYRYNPQGIRVAKVETLGGTTIQTDYLIDPVNHTGYAQVLEETADDGTTLTRIQYTIGDDVISQTKSTWTGSAWTANPTQYLLYDGHGSTRQLAGPTQTIVQSYDYDAYGVMLGSAANPADSAQTNYLYAGEQYDSSVQQYYNRARYYNPLNGLFNRVDPYSGNLHDPQSLHKYAFCHANPVNGIDPSGMMTLISIMSTMSNICRAFMKYYPILKVGLFVADILCVTNIVLKAITQGISSVTAGEWAELALITSTALLGGKIARRVTKALIQRALGLTDDALRSFKGLSQFIKSRGIILEVDEIIKFNKEGKKVLGCFDLVGKDADTPIIYLHKGGQTISTLIHEYVHYFQWKYFVGGTQYDWHNFSNIGQTKEQLEAVAYFIGDVFLK
jgi:RHS repeat-associated protein